MAAVAEADREQAASIGWTQKTMDDLRVICGHMFNYWVDKNLNIEVGLTARCLKYLKRDSTYFLVIITVSNAQKFGFVNGTKY